MEITQTQAKQIISSRTLVNQTGSYDLKVTSVTPYEDRLIVNLAAMTNYHYEEAKKLFLEGNFQEAVNQSISASQRMTDYIPSKGEIVKVYIDNITTNNGVKGLFVTSLTELKSQKASKVSFDFEFVEENQNETFTEQPKKGKVAMAHTQV